MYRLHHQTMASSNLWGYGGRNLKKKKKCWISIFAPKNQSHLIVKRENAICTDGATADSFAPVVNNTSTSIVIVIVVIIVSAIQFARNAMFIRRRRSFWTHQITSSTKSSIGFWSGGKNPKVATISILAWLLASFLIANLQKKEENDKSVPRAIFSPTLHRLLEAEMYMWVELPTIWRLFLKCKGYHFLISWKCSQDYLL